MWWEMIKTHCAAFVNSGWEHHCRQWITLTSCVLIVTNCKWSSRFLLVLRWCELVEGNGYRDIHSFVKLWLIVIYQPSDKFVRHEFEVTCCHLCLLSWWWILLGCWTDNVESPDAHTAKKYGLETKRRGPGQQLERNALGSLKEMMVNMLRGYVSH